LVTVAIAGGARPARAEPQLNGGLTLGAVARDIRTTGPSFAFSSGLHGDAIFLRERGSDIGVGPYVDLTSAALATAEPGGGVSLLVPIGDIATVLSAGGFYRFGRGDGAGAAVRLFFGWRGFNFHSLYALAPGVYVEGRFGFNEAKQSDVVLATPIDFEYLALPFIYAYEAIRH
jgi:hypothetical protein